MKTGILIQPVTFDMACIACGFVCEDIRKSGENFNIAVLFPALLSQASALARLLSQLALLAEANLPNSNTFSNNAELYSSF